MKISVPADMVSGHGHPSDVCKISAMRPSFCLPSAMWEALDRALLKNGFGAASGRPGHAWLNHALASIAFMKSQNRSEERRVGKEGVSTCRSRWSPYH